LHRRASVADDSDLLARQTDIVVPAAAVPAVTLEDSTTGKFRCILRVEEASYGGNDDPRPFLRLYLPSGSGIGDFDAVDFVFAIPFALVNEFVETDMVSEVVFGDQAFPVFEDLMACGELFIPIGIWVGG